MEVEDKLALEQKQCEIVVKTRGEEIEKESKIKISDAQDKCRAYKEQKDQMEKENRIMVGKVKEITS